MERDLKQGLVEHRVGKPRPQYGTQNLGSTYAMAVPALTSRRERKATVTAGFRCAPEMGPKTAIRTISIAPVASELHRSARASFPPASRSAIMPEPTMAASKNAVPKPSAKSLRGRLDVGT